MKLKFKVQAYQTAAVEAVVDCFAGQPKQAGSAYRIDPGKWPMPRLELESMGYRNSDLQLSREDVLRNIQAVQRRQNLPVSERLAESPAGPYNLDIEMETGTGKTYCYIKTIFELHKRYGWSKYIIVVPSIAIREGVSKSLEITREHFMMEYHNQARFFIYSSKNLTELEHFSSNTGINVMVINIQAFNAESAEFKRLIDTESDKFGSRKPIDVISSNQPILVLDEPQKMEGKSTQVSLAKFKPLLVLRYSATHRTVHNKVFRLDALDAYNQKLVKKIAVRGITVRGLSGSTAYLYLEGIEVSQKAPVARIELEVQQGNGIKRIVKRLGKGDNLYDLSNGLEPYRGYVIAQIDAYNDTVTFTNGQTLQAGEALGDITDALMRRIQIREAVKAHLEKERSLYWRGIKVLTLFFIDKVDMYRDYSQPDEQGEYARMFEEEYRAQVQEYLGELALDNPAYRQYLADIPAARTHNGYFAIDKKSKRLADPSIRKTGEEAGLSDDVDAYDLILRDKERLLSFEEPTRFIFSHSALREGWDNPNVFVMCMLKNSLNTISRRQEVGRGLRLAVDQAGDRQDAPETVHEINVLTVVASESYKDFVTNLQGEISASLSARPRIADKAYFEGKVFQAPDGNKVTVTSDMAEAIEYYLIQNGYVDRKRNIAEKYHTALKQGELAPMEDELAPYQAEIVQLINGVFSDAQLPAVRDDRKPKLNRLNDNFKRKEFQALWEQINRHAIYQVNFDSQELIDKSIRHLNQKLLVTPLQYVIQDGIQKNQPSSAQYLEGEAFQLTKTRNEVHQDSIHSDVPYDLLGSIAAQAQLTRSTVHAILRGVEPGTFAKFRQNPTQFITEVARLINEQKASTVIEHLAYSVIDSAYTTEIFTAAQLREEFNQESARLEKHIYDHISTDSKVELEFVTALEKQEEVVVYSKLPRGFLIPTPVGNYNPDWAIAFREGSVQHIYFVAETKGSLATLQLRESEVAKTKSAHRFFEALAKVDGAIPVKYGVVTSLVGLMDIFIKKAEPATATILPFVPKPFTAEPAEQYIGCVPFLPLQAAAGAFTEAQYLSDATEQWVRVPTSRKLRPGMFVAQVVGQSMEPRIPDGAYCLFQGPVEGSRQEKIVLVHMRDEIDPQTGHRYTVKRYTSEKAATETGWQHSRITLSPLNPTFPPIVLEDADPAAFMVVAEWLEVIG